MKINAPTVERRLGSRAPVQDRVDLEPVDADQKRRRRRWSRRRGARTTSAELLDVSITGVGLLAKPCPDLAVGTNVVMRWGRVEGTAIVRRTDELSDGTVLYGMQFTGDVSPLRDALCEAAGIFSREGDWQWHNPRRPN